LTKPRLSNTSTLQDPARFRERRQEVLTCCHSSRQLLFTNWLLKRILTVGRFVSVRSLIKHSAIRWLLLLAASLVVFFFAFHAKVGANDRALGAKPTAATASKMWVDRQKTEVPSVASSLIVLWLTVVLLYNLHLCRVPRIVKPFRKPALVRVSLLDAHSFRRPPPAF